MRNTITHFLKKSFIYKNLANEEEKFSETLINGLQVLDKEIKSMKDKIFSPEIAFKLYDTYGFPYDMTKSILFEKNIVLNDEQYEDIVKKNKEKQKEFSTGNKTKNENDFFEKIVVVLILQNLLDMKNLNVYQN